MPGKLTSPRVEPATIILLHGHTTKLPSESASLCSPISTSDLPREVSLCSGSPLTQELTAGSSAEGERQWSTQPQMGREYHSLPRDQGRWRRRSRKTGLGSSILDRMGARGMGALWMGALCSQTHSSCGCQHKTCTRSNQSPLHPGRGKGS